MMELFIMRLVAISNEEEIDKVYFHNLAFDGMFILNILAMNEKKYTVKPLVRNNMLYEIVVYERLNADQERVVLRFRDSLTLLPASLASLADTFCPECGKKGQIDHSSVQIENLISKREEVLTYMIQDIRLLGGIMLRAQDLFFRYYQVDITTSLTLSSLAMNIFRLIYYDPKAFPIYIPNRNADVFIRSGYYGGHSDVYQPYGENFFYYDVNSLYPYIMKTYPMPGGSMGG